MTIVRLAAILTKGLGTINFFALAAIILGLLFTTASNGFTQELSLLGGWIRDSNTSRSWEISYMEGLGEHFAWSFSWLNEGDLKGHDRDGQTFQLWARTSVLDPKLSLSVGAGPYLYFDTQPVGKDYKDVHGLGGVLTLAADYCLSNRWVLKLAYNHVATNDSDTDALLFGVGYQLDAPTSAGPRPWPKEQTQRTTGKELTVFVGNTILNTRNSEDSLATGVEYRRGIARYLDWTIGWMYEGDNDDLIERNGIVTQLWPTRAFFENRLALAAGFGIYAAIDKDRDEGSHSTLAGLISITGSYRLSQHYLVRSTWYRTLTDYDHDTDILVLGMGYRF